MSRIDRIKEELAWLKIVFTTSVVIDISLIAWFIRSHESVSGLLILLGFVEIMFITAVIGWANRAALRRFKDLEDE